MFEMGIFMACSSVDRNDAPMEREKLMLQDKDGIIEELKCLERLKGNGNVEWKRRNLPLTDREATRRRWYRYRSTGSRTMDTSYYGSIWILDKI